MIGSDEQLLVDAQPQAPGGQIQGSLYYTASAACPLAAVAELLSPLLFSFSFPPLLFLARIRRCRCALATLSVPAPPELLSGHLEKPSRV